MNDNSPVSKALERIVAEIIDMQDKMAYINGNVNVILTMMDASDKSTMERALKITSTWKATKQETQRRYKEFAEDMDEILREIDQSEP